MDEPIIISGKDIGALALNAFCPRCFWIRMRCNRKLPYQIFPGIFSSIDSFTKKVTNIHYEKNLSIPKWLRPFDVVKPVKSPHYSKFYIIDETTNIKLWGTPDEVFQRKDGSFFIVDYKTAKYTESQDDLLPLYEVQLNAYAYIGNRNQFNPVSGLGLVYYEPQTDLTSSNLDSILLVDGFHLPFRGKLHALPPNPDGIISPLLQKVRTIVDSVKSPDRKSNCKDCELVDQLALYLR